MKIKLRDTAEVRRVLANVASAVARVAGWPRWKQPTSPSFAVRLSCCGREDGVETFSEWADADAFRESYLSGPGVGPSGHARSAIIEAA